MEQHRKTTRIPRVLIVDDDVTLRMLVQEALAGLEVTLEEAADGVAAVEAFKRRPADLVLLDVRMPRMDGFSACGQLRQLPGGSQATIVMVTGLDDRQSIHRAYELGATDFITKPINWAILPARIRFLLRAHGAFQALQDSEARLIEAQRIASLGHWEWDIGEDTLVWSDQIFRIFGLEPRAFEGDLDAFMSRVHPDDRDAVRGAVRESLETDCVYSIDHRVLRPDGEVRTVHEQAEVQRDAGGNPLRMVGTVHDITERKKAEERIHRLAYYDSLTGLPNRHLFRELAGRALPGALRQRQSLALLHMDIDRFSRINDNLGRQAGDLLLRNIAKRIMRCVRSSDVVASPDAPGAVPYTLARLGADEFLILLTSLAQPDNTALVTQRLLACLSTPIRSGQGEYVITASVGIAMFPGDCGDLETLQRYAETSLHQVKSSGGNGFRFYSADMHDHSRQRLSLEARLHRALEHDEFELHYQPQVDIEGGRLVGMEALLRWRSPETGLVSPGDFIPLAEETGLIVPIGEWVLHEACRQLARWRDQGLEPIPVAVNLSSRQFAEANLMQTISRALADNRLNPALLELELTESLIMQDAAQVQRKLWAFHETGLKIAVDDFGTGYSSMSYLKRFPLDTLKIDRSFVRDLHSDPTDAAIVRAIIALGQALDLTTLAEGVETESQREVLSGAGCDRIQGFLISRPLPAEQIHTIGYGS